MDLLSCCQQVLLDHYPECDARRDVQRPAVTVRQCEECPHPDVLHAIRSNGSRGACSVSTGPDATPCGCKAFTPATDPVPAPEEGGPQK